MWVIGDVGAATITDESGAGLYTAEIDYGTEVRTAKLEALNARKSKLESQITDKESELSAAQVVVGQVNTALNNAVDAYIAAPADDRADEEKAVRELTTNRLEVVLDTQAIQIDLDFLKIALANVESDISELNALDLTNTQQVWCCDYTEDATGEIATIEINGEQPGGGTGILLAPGAPNWAPQYGILRNRTLLAPHQVYYNAAILPGWQKFKPTYRTGVLTAIDRENNQGSVTLDSANSSAQNLPINEDGALTEVPFEYMTCDHAAFETNDDVVVKFDGQAQANPKIIGFKDNPKSCGPPRLAFPLLNSTSFWDPTGTVYSGYTDDSILLPVNPSGPYVSGGYTQAGQYDGEIYSNGFYTESYGAVGTPPPSSGDVIQSITTSRMDVRVHFDRLYKQHPDKTINWFYVDLDGLQVQGYEDTHLLVANDGASTEELIDYADDSGFPHRSFYKLTYSGITTGTYEVTFGSDPQPTQLTYVQYNAVKTTVDLTDANIDFDASNAMYWSMWPTIPETINLVVNTGTVEYVREAVIFGGDTNRFKTPNFDHPSGYPDRPIQHNLVIYKRSDLAAASEGVDIPYYGDVTPPPYPY